MPDPKGIFGVRDQERAQAEYDRAVDLLVADEAPGDAVRSAFGPKLCDVDDEPPLVREGESPSA